MSLTLLFGGSDVPTKVAVHWCTGAILAGWPSCRAATSASNVYWWELNQGSLGASPP